MKPKKLALLLTMICCLVFMGLAVVIGTPAANTGAFTAAPPPTSAIAEVDDLGIDNVMTTSLVNLPTAPSNGDPTDFKYPRSVAAAQQKGLIGLSYRASSTMTMALAVVT